MKKIAVLGFSLLFLLAVGAGALAETNETALTAYHGEPGFSILYDAAAFAPIEEVATMLTLKPLDSAADVFLTVSFDAASGRSLEAALDDARNDCEADGFTVGPYDGQPMLTLLYTDTLHAVDGDNERIVCVVDAGIGIYTLVAAYPSAQASTYGAELINMVDTFELAEESGIG